MFSLEGQNRLNATSLLDYRHNASTNRLEVFRVTKSDISYNEIANAKDLQRTASLKQQIGRRLDYHDEAKFLYGALIASYLEQTIQLCLFL